MSVYKNILGKDFNTKPEAYKHFTSLRDQMINAGKLGEFNCLTEDTAVKKAGWILYLKIILNVMILSGIKERLG